jgi:hypothetical protein
LIHSVIYSKEHNLDIKNIIKNELIFSHFQFAKILHHFDYKINEFEKNKHNNKVNVFFQNTSVCSYYIIKCMMMMNYNSLFKLWGNEKNFKINKKYIDVYSEILKNDKIDFDIINKYMTYFNEIKNESREKKFIDKTMRLSLYQF